jgi:hypothetical protein
VAWAVGEQCRLGRPSPFSYICIYPRCRPWRPWQHANGMSPGHVGEHGRNQDGQCRPFTRETRGVSAKDRPVFKCRMTLGGQEPRRLARWHGPHRLLGSLLAGYHSRGVSASIPGYVQSLRAERMCKSATVSYLQMSRLDWAQRFMGGVDATSAQQPSSRMPWQAPRYRPCTPESHHHSGLSRRAKQRPPIAINHAAHSSPPTGTNAIDETMTTCPARRHGKATGMESSPTKTGAEPSMAMGRIPTSAVHRPPNRDPSTTSSRQSPGGGHGRSGERSRRRMLSRQRVDSRQRNQPANRLEAMGVIERATRPWRRASTGASIGLPPMVPSHRPTLRTCGI